MSCELPDETAFRQLWENFVAKMHNKAKIETEREKLSEMMKKQKEECSLFSDDKICK